MAIVVSSTRRFEFDAGHRVLNHGSKCANLHGHRYVADVSICPMRGLNNLGMVIDFADMKKIIGDWIDTNWDHTMILHPDDPLLRAVIPNGGIVMPDAEHMTKLFGPKHPYIMPFGTNPTSENMAVELLKACQSLLKDTPLLVTDVKLYETPNCSSMAFDSIAADQALNKRND